MTTCPLVHVPDPESGFDALVPFFIIIHHCPGLQDILFHRDFPLYQRDTYRWLSGIGFDVKGRPQYIRSYLAGMHPERPPLIALHVEKSLSLQADGPPVIFG